jgi:murein L,D-transpeptidase YafK
MKKVIRLLLLIFCCTQLSAQNGFKTAQLKNKRVKTAYDKKWKNLQTELTAIGITSENFDVLIRVFKYEKELEVWVKTKNTQVYKKLKTLAICQSSGELGPKRKEGDMQVPEGFYRVSAFNPASSYHLSLKVNYPNASDRIKGQKPLGGDIMIHGNCVTIGCIPIENDPIEELYVLCVQAQNAGNAPLIDIFPCRFTKENENYLTKNYSKEKNDFWANLKEGYNVFEQTKRHPTITITETGEYRCNL